MLSVGSSMYAGRDTLELEIIVCAWFYKQSEATFKVDTYIRADHTPYFKHQMTCLMSAW